MANAVSDQLVRESFLTASGAHAVVDQLVRESFVSLFPASPVTTSSAYSTITLQQANLELSNRLFDSNQQFWTFAELTQIWQEAFRIWQALTGYWRDEFVFPLVQGTTWYDLTQVVNTLRPYTIADSYLFSMIENALLEPSLVTYPLLWLGSNQFTYDDVLNAVNRRRDEVLGLTGCTMTRRTVGAVPGKIVLPDSVIDLRRVYYISNTGGVNSPVFDDDIWGLQAGSYNWPLQPAGTPIAFVRSNEPQTAFEVDRTPNPGTYDILTIEGGPALSFTAASQLFVPDDWAWVIKYGALSDLLGRDMNAKDETRSKYCEGRFREGVSLLTHAPATLAMRMNNIPLQIEGVRGVDLYRSSWQGETAGTPNLGITAGLNLVAFAPPPDGLQYSIDVTVIRNAPVPVNPNDFLQVGRDLYDVFLDYGQHVASFKMGGADFLNTMPLLDNFMQMASDYASRTNEQGEFTRTLYKLSQREAALNPRYEMDLEPGVDQ